MNKLEYIDHCWDLVEQFIEIDSQKYGEYIRKQVDKFKQWTEDSRYEFRAEEVDKVFRFCSYIRIQLKNSYVQFPMLPYQAFFLALIFGWYLTDTETRKHQEALIFIGRKNGKTAFSALIILYGFMKDGVTDPQSMLLAMNAKQASNALRYAKSIIYHSPALLRRLHPQRYKIVSKDRSDQGFIEVMSTVEPERLEGFSPSMCILDEIAHMESNKAEDVYNSVKNGTGARKNPLTILATTAGTKDNQFITELLQYYRDVLDDKIEDKGIAGLIFQPDKEDDLNDEIAWKKANPAIGTITSMESIRNSYQKAINSASTRTYYQFLTRRVNVFTEEPTNWLDPFKLNECFTELNIEDYKGREVFIGIDLSVTKDLSAIALCFGEEREVDIFVYFFMAHNPNNLLRKGNFDLKPFIDTYIHRSDNDVVDYKAMLNKLIEIDNDFQVVKLLYDPYNAPYFIHDVQENTEIFCEKYAQTPLKFNVPLTFIQDAVATKTIRFDINPVLRWNFTNVVVSSMDSNDNVKINKRKKKDAVDGVVAATQAVGGFIEYTNAVYDATY